MKKILIVVNNDKNKIIFKGTEQDYIDFCKKDEIEQEEIGIYSCDIKKDLFDNNTPFGECSSNLELHEIETNEEMIFMVMPFNKYKKNHNIMIYTFEEIKEKIKNYEEETGDEFNKFYEEIDINKKQEIINLVEDTNFLAMEGEQYVEKIYNI